MCRYGIELKVPAGKNNGTLHDVEYFVCEDKHGMFARLTNVTLAKAEEDDTAPAPTPVPTVLPAQALGAKVTTKNAVVSAAIPSFTVAEAQITAPTPASTEADGGGAALNGTTDGAEDLAPVRALSCSCLFITPFFSPPPISL